MYYLIDWRVDEEAEGLNLAEIDKIPDTDIPWTMGMCVQNTVNQPIQLALDKNSGSDMPDAFFIGIPLFSERLLNILYAKGVDNIQVYDAAVIDVRNGQIHKNYKAVNIVGLVSCANLDASTYIEGSGPPLMYFDHLVINKESCTNLKIFRLGESASTIIVSKDIADAIMDSKLTGIRLLEIESR
jgi:hypothetical protein